MNYVSRVAELFSSRCGNVTILSPMDYALIAEWEKQEIPLDVVLEAISRTFDKLAGTGNFETINSLEYFRNEVKIKYAEWLQNL